MARFVLSLVLGISMVGAASAENTPGPINTKSLSRLSSMVEEIEQAKLEEGEELAAKELVLGLARRHSPTITLEELKTFNNEKFRKTVTQSVYAVGAFTLAAALLTLIYLVFGSDALEILAYLAGLSLIIVGGQWMPFGQIGAALSANIILSFAMLWRLHRWTKSKVLSTRYGKIIILGVIAALWASSAIWCASALLGGIAVGCFLIWLIECLVNVDSQKRSRDSDSQRLILAGVLVAIFGIVVHIDGVIPSDFDWLVSPFAYTALRLGASLALGVLIVTALDSPHSTALVYDLLLLMTAGICMAFGSFGIPALMGIASWSLVIWTITKICLIKTAKWGLFMKFSAISIVCWVVGRMVQTYPQFFAAL